MYVWNGSEWVQVGNASTPQTTIDISQSAPDGALVGSIWYDDEASGLYVYDGDFWVNISGPRGPAGPQGNDGPKGDDGPQGSQGVEGESPDTSIFLTIESASATYATQEDLENIDLEPYLTVESASTTYATKSELAIIDVDNLPDVFLMMGG